MPVPTARDGGDGGRKSPLEVVDGARRWLEAETQLLRAAVRDAEAWLARIELDAALINEVEAAEELLRFWQQSWEDHVELCRLFAGVAGRMYAAERAKVLGLAGMTV